MHEEGSAPSPPAPAGPVSRSLRRQTCAPASPLAAGNTFFWEKLFLILRIKILTYYVIYLEYQITMFAGLPCKKLHLKKIL